MRNICSASSDDLIKKIWNIISKNKNIK
jgi:hypothetical protein